MKKLIEVTIPATKIAVKSKEVYICDICGKQHDTTICSSCGRDICYGGLNKCCMDDPEETGDYPAHFCPICYNLKFVKYLDERTKLAEKYYADDLAIDARVKEESLLFKEENK